LSELTTRVTEIPLPRQHLFSPDRVAAPARAVIETLAVANEILVVIAIAADLALTFANTILRSFFSEPILWQQDASLICMSVITFLGGAAAIHRNMTLSFTSVVDSLTGWKKDALVAAGWWACLGVAAATFVGFPAYFDAASREQMPTLSLHEGWTAIWIGVGYALIVLFALEKLARLKLRANLIGICTVGAGGLGLLAWRAAYGGAFADHRLILPMLIVVALAFVAGVPIAFVLGLSGLAFVIISQQGVIGQALAAYQLGISDFILLALPFFMLAGALMTATGMSERLVSAVESVVGHWRAGLLITQVAAVYVFSGISGSKIADVSAVGGVLERPLLSRG
jgi:C4-dicarboxylate transporter, DctM subunit